MLVFMMISTIGFEPTTFTVSTTQQYIGTISTMEAIVQIKTDLDRPEEVDYNTGFNPHSIG